MATHASPGELSQTMEHLSVVLPGLGEPTSIVLDSASPAVGHTLADINLRGLTGATVLGISRSADAEEHTLVPSGHERLRAGDVLIIGGPNEAVEAARDILNTGYHSPTPPRARERQRAPA
jgi:CPA2 family monovalent cation:H+ antiporter-2